MSAIVELKSHENFTSRRRKLREIDVTTTDKRHVERAHETRHVEATKPTLSVKNQYTSSNLDSHWKTAELSITETRSNAWILTISMPRDGLDSTNEIPVTKTDRLWKSS